MEVIHAVKNGITYVLDKIKEWGGPGVSDEEIERLESDPTACFSGPLDTNLKCIYISLVLAASYWFLPPRNKYILVAILYMTYLYIAYYDYIFECKRGFGPSFLRMFYYPFKPNDKQSILYTRLCVEKDVLIWAVDILVLVLVVWLGVPAFRSWEPKPSITIY